MRREVCELRGLVSAVFAALRWAELVPCRDAELLERGLVRGAHSVSGWRGRRGRGRCIESARDFGDAEQQQTPHQTRGAAERRERDRNRSDDRDS